MLIIKDEEVQTLKRLGLTTCQAKIYSALVKSGPATAKTISLVANVGREDIYRVMPTLQEIGLVEKLIKSPVEFEAIPAQTGLEALIEHKRKEYTELKAKTEQLLSNFKNNGATTTHSSEENQFVLIPNGEAVMRGRAKAIENTETSLDVIHSWKIHLQCEDRFSNLASFTELADKALKRGVRIRIIVNKPGNSKVTKTAAAFIKKPNFKLQFISTTPLAFVAIHDNKQVFLSTSSTERLEASPALWSSNPALLRIMTDYFEATWLVAKEKTQKEEH